MNIEIKNNLTSIGKEIISSNTNKNTNKKRLTLESPKEYNIKKEIKDELDIKTIKPYNSINSFRNSNIFNICIFHFYSIWPAQSLKAGFNPG